MVISNISALQKKPYSHVHKGLPFVHGNATYDGSARIKNTSENKFRNLVLEKIH